VGVGGDVCRGSPSRTFGPKILRGLGLRVDLCKVCLVALVLVHGVLGVRGSLGRNLGVCYTWLIPRRMRGFRQLGKQGSAAVEGFAVPEKGHGTKVGASG